MHQAVGNRGRAATLCLLGAVGLLRLGGLGLGGFGALSGCADTAGRPVTVTVAARARDRQGRPAGTFTNARGWTVTFEAARALVGPVYFIETTTDDARALAWLRHLLPIRTAHAHVVVAAGRTVGEVLAPRVLDLLDPQAELGPAQGVTGTCRQLEVHLRPPGSLAPANPEALPGLFGHGLYVAGVAEKDGQRLRFEGGLTLPADPPELRQIAGIPVADLPFDDRAPGTPTLAIDLENWLWNVDFAPLLAEVDATDPEAPVALRPGTPAHAAWQRAVTARETWRLELL